VTYYTADDFIDPDDDETGGDDGVGEGWGTPEDLAAVIRHVAEDPDPWGVISDQIAEERSRRARGDR